MIKKVDKKLLSLRTMKERFDYLNNKKKNEFNKTIHRGRS
jgi:hypothetical protein